MMKKTIELFSNEISNYRDQLNYKDSFLNKFGDKIDMSDPFYFDNVYIVDSVTGETIRGAQLERDSWKQITNILLKYFHIEI